MLIALALAVATWGGGFDVLYALQDVEFDGANGCSRCPWRSASGARCAIARVLHVVTVVCLALVGVAIFAGTHGGFVLRARRAIAAGLLVYEHSLVRADDFSRLDAAFFTMNGIISITFFVCVLAERW